ncbi:conserved hypothetical protein [Sporisorium reilianum SRZ2]|uniref:Uncharacterized protein n=1 Tax=Sporisorium reilianum (strain SRZ2) TaxID=999809 RepID=E6ZXF6_SPORE|nr:conserved hypothetical protein [Sporisorium reilianum SRZ2]
MRSSDHDRRSWHRRKAAHESSASPTSIPSSSFVSTLSNALNISTPKATSSISYPDAHRSAPAKLAYTRSTLDPLSPSKGEALRTPTRSRDPPPMLSLSGHEAFQSPSTPISPWSTDPADGFVATNGKHGCEPPTSAALDHAWLLSGPSSDRDSNMFEIGAAASPIVTAAPSTSNGRNDQAWTLGTQSTTDYVRSDHRPAASWAGCHGHSGRASRFYIDGGPTAQQRALALSTLNPTSNAAISPSQAPTGSRMMDASFSNSNFDQDTPCMSTHLLPNYGLTQSLSVQGMSANGSADQLDFGLPFSNGLKQSDLTGASDMNSAAGLGLGLSTDAAWEQIEVLTSPTHPSNRPPMLVDEMGRWMLDLHRQQLSEGTWHSEQSCDGSGARADRRAAQRTSMSSLSTATETSFTSHSNSSTWDSSFAEASSPTSGEPSAFADRQLISTPASSIGFSGSSDLHASKAADPRRVASASESVVATPEVAMHDFSEFGQSVSIEQMAEGRWRTWPRTSDSAASRGQPATSAANINSADIVHPSTEEPRASLDTLSVSTTSTRSRLMAEPYNKSLRSGRPSSSASTGSRGSIGTGPALEGQQGSGCIGPTRPRSYIATGSLRMSSTTRTSSNGATGPDSGQTPAERASSTAIALQRSRGITNSIFSPSSSSSGSSSAMKSTRSADSFAPLDSSGGNAARSKNAVDMRRSATNVEGSNLATQRPQSMLDTSSHSETSRRLGAGTESKARVGFNEVSLALDTLRMFLKQKSSSDVHNGHDESPETINEDSSPGKPSRTLRRSKGVLPPRGAACSVDEFGFLPTAAPASLSALPDNVSISSAHDRSKSHGAEVSVPSHASSSSLSRQDDKLAILEALSDRVMRLKAQSEAASMPPPTARPASMVLQQGQTRREMHDEYLRKRSSGI